MSFPDSEWIRACALSDLVSDRIHLNINNRFITLLRTNGTLTCIDSICFHMGGPLAAGDIEDVAGYTCIICPWHYLKIDVHDGRKLSHRITSFDDSGKPVAFKWEKSSEAFQRVHKVRLEGHEIFIRLSTEPPAIQSDRYCSHAEAAKGLTKCTRSGSDGKRIKY